MTAFVYRYDPKRPTLSALSRSLNGLGYGAVAVLLVMWIMTLLDSCDCSLSKKTSNAVDFKMVIVAITASAYIAFVCLVINMLLPPNARITQSTTSEYMGTAYGNGVAMDVHRVTTTTTNTVGEIEPLRRKWTKHNIHNILVHLVVVIPLLVMVLYLNKFANDGCATCCEKFYYDDYYCKVKNDKYLGSKDAWIDYARKYNTTR
ncbi:hypothetical protein SAMD00019534_120310 [Acytostelium subglobosum LB1]|uniref:hypothetical protein n=1 Tax=Acytostelium subglobosum LB1 TaxID=1410327 RepID=UPI0006450167|nr:hypothetical protein SAMD00019534_120310 [Acytostelium subglobosum LB1]GAM28855.1 hypothetical protein SAMD00019534_120310 [Acytostelium subglobosum LB1]|eukprot:XP_012748227.1 hypothetical protein SAMD00019534_120310 [Acytostelium subglobosum LB1]